MHDFLGREGGGGREKEREGRKGKRLWADRKRGVLNTGRDLDRLVEVVSEAGLLASDKVKTSFEKAKTDLALAGSSTNEGHSAIPRPVLKRGCGGTRKRSTIQSWKSTGLTASYLHVPYTLSGTDVACGKTFGPVRTKDIVLPLSGTDGAVGGTRQQDATWFNRDDNYK
eukprot:770496-Rhodomonas_salina.1